MVNVVVAVVFVVICVHPRLEENTGTTRLGPQTRTQSSENRAEIDRHAVSLLKMKCVSVVRVKKKTLANKKQSVSP